MENETNNEITEVTQQEIVAVPAEVIKEEVQPKLKSKKVKDILIFCLTKCISIIKRVWSFATSKPNIKENAFQYLFRQLILTDSDGNPSWTVTALVFVMGVIGIAVYTEYHLAMSAVIKYTPDGKIASWALKGFSTEFYYLVISLSVVITGLFRARQKDNAKAKSDADSDDSGSADGGTISTVIDTAKAVIGKMKG